MGSAKRRHPGGKPYPSVEHDRELLQFNVRLAKCRQALADTNRIERKAFREYARVENAVSAYTRELCSLLDERGFTRGVGLPRIPEGGESVRHGGLNSGRAPATLCANLRGGTPGACRA